MIPIAEIRKGMIFADRDGVAEALADARSFLWTPTGTTIVSFPYRYIQHPVFTKSVFTMVLQSKRSINVVEAQP